MAPQGILQKTFYVKLIRNEQAATFDKLYTKHRSIFKCAKTTIKVIEGFQFKVSVIWYVSML